MGEAKRKKARLGEWYGNAVTPGHPDYVPPEPPPAPLVPRIGRRRASSMLRLMWLIGLGGSVAVSPKR